MVTKIINQLFTFYYLLIIIRIFLTWIPSINWESQPFNWVRGATDSYLNIFRRIIPPLGGLDFSPIIALIVLQLLQTAINTTFNFLF